MSLSPGSTVFYFTVNFGSIPTQNVIFLPSVKNDDGLRNEISSLLGILDP
jgi:hypothetical protein